MEQQYWQGGPFSILHCYADIGIESEVLSSIGEVVRVGWNAREPEYSQPVKGDAHHLPFDSDETQFDLGLFHPPCAKFSPVTNISGDADEHENQIPLARQAAEEYCLDYIIENRPESVGSGGLISPDNGSLVTFNGKHFGKRLKYERSFECSFPVDGFQSTVDLDTEISPYFYSDRSTEFWRLLKGYTGSFPKGALAKNSIPRPIVEELLMAFLRYRGDTDSQPSRSSYADSSDSADSESEDEASSAPGLDEW